MTTEPSTPFPYDDLDSIEAHIVERVKAGAEFGDLMRKRDEHMAEVYGARAVRGLLGYVGGNSKNMTMALCALTWGTGTFYDGKTCEQWAEEFGVTKQDFEKLAKRLCGKLGIKMTRTLRGEK